LVPLWTLSKAAGPPLPFKSSWSHFEPAAVGQAACRLDLDLT